MPAPRLTFLAAMALLSGSVLAYEVLLMRLLSVVQWHHFAYMIISLALLGYGASGVALTAFGERLSERFETTFPVSVALFGASAVAGFLVAQRLPFNPMELFWGLGQAGWLAALYGVLMVPFFFAAGALGVALIRYRSAIPRLYAADLAGAGAGALGVTALLHAATPVRALAAIGALASAAALVAALPAVRVRPAPVLLAGLVLAGSGVLLVRPPALTPSPYKGLSQALEARGAERVEERSSPLGVVTVVRNDQVPFRHAPGLSLTSPAAPPEQVAVFSDADGMSVITRWGGHPGELEFLRHLTSAAPYALLAEARVLVLGAGTGLEVLQALAHGATRVDAVEMNADVVDLVRTRFDGFSGHLYTRPQVRLHLAEARSFVRQPRPDFDLIQVALLDALTASSSGLHAISEGYLYTVEAFRDYLARLEPDGLLAVTRWVKLPPRDDLKVFATALEALRRQGVDRPAARLAWLRGWSTSTVLVKNGDLSDAEVAALADFCADRSFDAVFLAGRPVADPNRHAVVAGDPFSRGAEALVGGSAEGFLQHYRFDVRPATDDRPYFFNFFRWQALPEVLAHRAEGALGLLDAGYLVLWMTLAQALLASLVLIALPAWLYQRRRARGGTGRWRGPVVLYFVAIGLGFLFVEVAAIQQLVLFLGHPVYAASAVLGGLLTFAGLGSLLAGRLTARQEGRGPGGALFLAVTGALAVVALAHQALLPLVLEQALHWPLALRAALALVAIAPLALMLGLPFPMGLARVAQLDPDLIPLAWAANGCASVVAAVLATLLAMEVGFRQVLMLAIALYLLAGLIGARRLATAVP